MAWEVSKPITLKYQTKTKTLTNGAAGEDQIAQSILNFAQECGISNFVVVANGHEVSDPMDLPSVDELSGSTVELRNYAKAGC